MSFPQRLRKARESAGLSIRALAAAAEVAPGSVVHYEDGKTDPARGIVERLATALGVTPQWLAYGIQPKEMNMDRFSKIDLTGLANNLLPKLEAGTSLRDALCDVPTGAHTARRALMVRWAILEGLVPSDTLPTPANERVAFRVLSLWDPTADRKVLVGSFEKALVSTTLPA